MKRRENWPFKGKMSSKFRLKLINPPEFVESTPSVPDNLCYVIRSKLFEKPEQKETRKDRYLYNMTIIFDYQNLILGSQRKYFTKPKI